MSLNRIAASSGIALERLQRHLGREVGVRRQAHEAAGAGARRAVLGQVAAGLAHQPDRRVRRSAATGRRAGRCRWRAGAGIAGLSPLRETHNRRDLATDCQGARRCSPTTSCTPSATRRTSASTGCSARATTSTSRASAPTRAARSRTASRSSMVEAAEAVGRAQAGRDDRRADLGQHRRRPGDGRRGQGLQAGPRHARQHERRAAPADARLRRDLRADAAREGHERRDRRAPQELVGRRRPAPGCRSSSTTRPTSTSTRAPPRRRSPPTSRAASMR